jgi:uncharacterized protein (DUF433 family)
VVSSQVCDAVGVRSKVSVLHWPVYGVHEAAGLLGLRPDRVRAWLDGYTRRGVRYPPLVREAHTGEDIVSWGEFVELGYLREYRRHGISLQRLRPVIDELRARLETPYPLATARLYEYGRELAAEVQERHDIPATIAIVVPSGQSFALAGDARRFLHKVSFAEEYGGDVDRLHPAGTVSPVVIDPLVRFGQPTVSGATDRLWELYDAGETVGEMAAGYDLADELIRTAIAYPEQQRSLAG